MNARDREKLFMEMAAIGEGVSAQAVYEVAKARGDTVTQEAYFNVARRLAFKGLFTKSEKDGRTIYSIRPDAEEQWLDEAELIKLADPDYPLIALSVVREATRQIQDIPNSVWMELRTRLMEQDARTLVSQAIRGYCDHLLDEDYLLQTLETNGEISAIANQEQQLESQMQALKMMVRFGLGLSCDAVDLPQSISALRKVRERDAHSRFYDVDLLDEELASRIEPGSFLRNQPDPSKAERNLFIAAVDGSTRSGLLAHEGESGDLAVGSFPQFSVNTSVAKLNAEIKLNGRTHPLFTRLPEKPEDMQQRENRYTILAKLLYPDITDGEYLHLLSNAMDVLEQRATLRVLRRWETSLGNIEVRPADIVFRDGTLVPQDRDFTHYKQPDSFGRVVRDMIDLSSQIAQQIEANDQTVVGVVKQANLRVLGPVVTWFVLQLMHRGEKTQILTWPKDIMNAVPDQILLSRILTAGRVKNDPWTRSCVVSRPYHATTNFAESYKRQTPPAQIILQRAERARRGETDIFERTQDRFLASDDFRDERDPYIRLLEGCWFSSFFVAAVPRLDFSNRLPRIEVLLPNSTRPGENLDPKLLGQHVERAIAGLRQQGIDVSDEHQIFDPTKRLDIVPRLISEVHDIVKAWGAELMSRVHEVIGSYISRFVRNGIARGVRCRPWKRSELALFAQSIQRERDIQAGIRPANSVDGQPSLDSTDGYL